MVEALGSGRYMVTGIRDSGVGTRRIAYAVRERGRTWVFLDGRTYLFEPDARETAGRVHRTDDQVALSAPMPATVIAINVAPGQDVTAGDVLVLLEAMKMEVPVKAPRAGRVKLVTCREGDLVQPGIPLIELV